MYLKCRQIVEGNLIKQAKTICKPSKEDFDKYFALVNIDDNNDDTNVCEVEISKEKAKEYLDTWMKIQNDHSEELQRLRNAKDDKDLQTPLTELELSNLAKFEALNLNQEDENQFLWDQLFVETGEDVEDIIIAFKTHKLM